MSDDNWTGVDWPCFDDYDGTQGFDELLECEERVNPRKIWKCNWLLAGGHWYDCTEGGASPHCPESLRPRVQSVSESLTSGAERQLEDGMTDPTKVETLGGVLDSIEAARKDQLDPRELFGFSLALSETAIRLGAATRIIRGVCPTCGGNPEGVQVPDQAGSPDGEPTATWEECPTCHGEQPVSIVTAEVWEIAVSSVFHEDYFPLHPDVKWTQQYAAEIWDDEGGDDTFDVTFRIAWEACEMKVDTILTALGPFVVADEVVIARELRQVAVTPTAVETIQRTIELQPGDTIYIKRRESDAGDVG